MEKYTRLGFEYLKKGWPDFLFYKGDKIIMVEVKKELKIPTQKMGLSSHQRKMREILSKHFDYKVEYL